MKKWAILLIPVILMGCINIKINGDELSDHSVPSDAKITTHKTIEFEVKTPNFSFELSNINGDIHVMKGKSKKIKVVLNYTEAALKYFKIYQYEHENEAGVIVKKKSKFIKHTPRKARIDIDLFIPDSLNGIDLSSVNGSIDLPFEIYAGSLEISCVNGSIKGNVWSKNASVSSVNGRIKISAKVGSVDVSNVNGTIWVTFPTKFNDAELSVVNGSVHTRIPRNIGLSLEATTVHGSIHVNSVPDDAYYQKSGHFVGKNVRIKIGDGSSNLGISSVNGSIYINFGSGII